MARSLRALVAVGCLLSLTACVDQHGPTALAPGEPEYAIADAATGWNPAFYWLPPIVPPFAPSGVFDPSQEPVVRICAWSFGSCRSQIAEYSLTSGTGGQTVTLDPVAEHYQVMWRTGDPVFQSLTVGGVYRLSVSLDGRDVGFADAFIVARPRDRAGVDATQYVPVVRGSNFKIKFRIETQRQFLDLHFDHKADGPLGLDADPTTYHLTLTNDPSGTMTAFYTDGIAPGTFVGERRFARFNPVVRMVYSDVDYFAVWAGRQNPDNSIEGAWFDAAGQTGDFRLVEQRQTVNRSNDAGVRSIPGTHKTTGAAELDGEWVLDFDRTYDGVYVPEAGGTNALAITATNSTDLVAVYTDGNTGAYQGAVYTARHTSVLTLLFTNTDYFAAFTGAMTDRDTIVGVYFDAEGYSGDFVLARQGVADDFDDGDFTQNPAWTEWNPDDYPGVVSVVGGALRFFRTDAGGNGAALGVEMNTNIAVTDQTTVSFDAKAVYRSVASGCGFSCGEYPANVQITVEDASGQSYTVRYAVNYGSAVQDQSQSGFQTVRVLYPPGHMGEGNAFSHSGRLAKCGEDNPCAPVRGRVGSRWLPG